MPSPENVGGRRTPRQATILRVRWRPEILDAKRRARQPARTARPAHARPARTARGVEERTTRARRPRFCRALTYWPSSVSVARDLQRRGIADVDLGDERLALQPARGARRGPPPATGSSGIGALAFWMTSRRWAVQQQVRLRERPEGQRPGDPGRAGAPSPRTAYSVSPTTVKIVAPVRS